MIKYILIEVENQSINEPDTYDTYEEAYLEMKRRYDNLVEDYDDANIHSNYASIQSDTYNVDWRIYKVTM